VKIEEPSPIKADSRKAERAAEKEKARAEKKAKARRLAAQRARAARQLAAQRTADPFGQTQQLAPARTP
jgi:membrane protein involved in colicin uptake